MEVVAEWRSKPHNPTWKHVPGPGELAACWINDWVFWNLGHVQVLKSRNKEFFHLWNYVLNEFVARQTINAGKCASGGLGPSDKINQAQSRTKLRNFGWADTRTKTRTSSGTGIHRNLLLEGHKKWNFTLFSIIYLSLTAIRYPHQGVHPSGIQIW